MTACTDDERREVAERLRETKAECEERGYPWMCDDLILALGYDHDYEAGDEIFDRLADLIEPTSDPTGRGIDSIYQWCFERLEGADGAEDELFCSIMRAIEDYRHPERATAHTVRAVDRDTLLELAEDVTEAAAMATAVDASKSAEMLAELLLDIARSIREACGHRIVGKGEPTWL